MFKVDELLKATGGRLACGGSGCRVRGISIDSRTIKRGDAYIVIKGNSHDGHRFIPEALRKGASCIIYSSCFKASLQPKAAFIKVRDTTAALGDIAAFWRARFDIPVVVVTGSNGKTTTKDMIAHILSRKFKVLKNEGTKNNHIGLPMTLLKLDGSHDFAVLEAGTSHPGEIPYLARIASANIGVITNIGPSHLEHFGALNSVRKEKVSLLKYLCGPRIAVLNSDCRFLSGELKKNKKAEFGFGVNNRCDFMASSLKRAGRGMEFKVNSKIKFTLPVLGYYNIYNALAAVAVARICGMEYRDIASGLRRFVTPAGRLNVTKVNKITFIDDTYNANPLSLSQALKALDGLKVKGRKIFIMGDMLELGAKGKRFHLEAGRKAMDACDIFLAAGRLAKLAGQSALACDRKDKLVFICGSALEARNILFKQISPKPEDVVLVKGSRGMKMEQVFKT